MHDPKTVEFHETTYSQDSISFIFDFPFELEVQLEERTQKHGKQFSLFEGCGEYRDSLEG